MPLMELVGHQDSRRKLAEAIRTDRLPQVIVLSGPAGIGKQRFALWVAQRLMCSEPGNSIEPCGRCRPCQNVLRLAHPDVHWLVPIPRPKAAEPDKQADEAAEAIAQVLEERREAPLWTAPDGMAGHGMATVRLLQRRAAMKPVEGGWRVFLIGDADRLSVQEGAETSANALLKLLEEPPARTLIVLTATDSRQLLPTIVSRAVLLRLTPLDDATVAAFLAGALPELGAQERRTRVARAHGSIGRALAGGEDAPAAQAAERLLAAVTGGPAARSERALAQGWSQARGEFAAMLDALAVMLGDAARQASGAAPGDAVPQALEGHEPGTLLRALDRVLEARTAAQGNVNPQLLVGVLQNDLAEALCR